jgi:hypothetical protein
MIGPADAARQRATTAGNGGGMDRRGFLTVAGAALAGMAAPAGRAWPAVPPAAAVISAFGAALPWLDGAAAAFAAACGAPLVRDAASSAAVHEAVAAGRVAFGCLAVADGAGAAETGPAAGPRGGAVVLAGACLGEQGLWSRRPSQPAARAGTLAHGTAAGPARPLAPHAARRALEAGESDAVLGLGPAADTALGLHRIAPYVTLDPARPAIWIVWLAHAPSFEALGGGAQAALRRTAAAAARLVPPPAPLHDLAARGVQVRFAPSGAAA